MIESSTVSNTDPRLVERFCHFVNPHHAFAGAAVEE